MKVSQQPTRSFPPLAVLGVKVCMHSTVGPRRNVARWHGRRVTFAKASAVTVALFSSNPTVPPSVRAPESRPGFDLGRRHSAPPTKPPCQSVSQLGIHVNHIRRSGGENFSLAWAESAKADMNTEGQHLQGFPLSFLLPKTAPIPSEVRLSPGVELSSPARSPGRDRAAWCRMEFSRRLSGATGSHSHAKAPLFPAGRIWEIFWASRRKCQTRSAQRVGFKACPSHEKFILWYACL